MDENDLTLEELIDANGDAPIEVRAVPDDVAKDELDKAGLQAQQLMARKEFREVVGALLASRQLYAMAYIELERLLDERPDTHPIVKEILIESTANQAGKPFDEFILLKGFQETVFPWMLTTTSKHNEQDREALKQEQEDAEKERRVRPLPIGVPREPGGETALDREQALVLVGYRPAVLWVLDQIITSVLAAQDKQVFTVVRFQASPPREAANPYLVRLGPNIWHGQANANDRLPEMAVKYLYPQLYTRPDLIMVDDLPRLITNGFLGRPASAVAGDALRRLRKWASDGGAGVVSGILLAEDEGTLDLSGPAWERLRTFSLLRPVTVLREAPNLAEGQCRIRLGQNAHYWDVDRSVLDTYGGSRLIL